MLRAMAKTRGDLTSVFADANQPNLFAAVVPLLEEKLSGLSVESYPGAASSVWWKKGSAPAIVLKEQDDGAHLWFDPNVVLDDKIGPAWSALAPYHEAM